MPCALCNIHCLTQGQGQSAKGPQAEKVTKGKGTWEYHS